MKIKRFAAILAAAVICCCSFVYVSAEDNESSEIGDEIALPDEEDSNETESEEITSDDGLWTYTIITNNDTGEEYVSIHSYKGKDTEIDIPRTMEGKTVKSLGKYAFYENILVEKFIIHKELVLFDDFPFFGCQSLKEFVVDDDNTVFGTTDKGALITDDGAYFVCCPPASVEKEYTVPDGISVLDSGAFAVCKNLEKINLPDSLIYIDKFCFSECTALNNVVIPENVSELGIQAFTGCTALTDISLPDNMTTIDSGAFSLCTSLEKITFPKNLTTIGQAAFASAGFYEIEIPPTVREIGYSAFGYKVAQDCQLVAMNNFVIKGYEGSTAQSYCAENSNVEFIKIDPPETDESDSDPTQDENGNSGKNENGEAGTNSVTDQNESGKSDSSTALIIGLCIGGGIVIAAGAAVVVMIRKRRASQTDDE